MSLFASIKQLSIYNTPLSQFELLLLIPVSLKTPSPINVTLFGIVIEVKALQPEKAHLPIELRLLDIVTEVRLVHIPKASSPIEVTLFGIVIEVKL